MGAQIVPRADSSNGEGTQRDNSQANVTPPAWKAAGHYKDRYQEKIFGC